MHSCYWLSFKTDFDHEEKVECGFAVYVQVCSRDRAAYVWWDLSIPFHVMLSSFLVL